MENEKMRRRSQGLRFFKAFQIGKSAPSLSRAGFFASIALFFASVASVPAEESLATENERVVVVANDADPESVALARYYMHARGIPEGNLVALPFPQKETLSWKEFGEKVFSPLRREFVARGWIDGIIYDTVPADDFYRVRLVFPSGFAPENSKNADKISYVVLCRGVPLRIANDASKQPPLPQKTSPDAPQPKRSPLSVNCASVDSELALLGVPASDANSAVASPFFKDNLKKDFPARKMYLRVARLDGITPADARSLVDSALAAERTGLLGRAYIDIGGPHALGDKWLECCAETTRKLGFDTTVDRAKSLLGATTRYDAPALYFGWYSGNVGGFFLDPNFRFPAGAVAIHIHSFSATSMRSRTAWTPGLVARGVAATVGNVYEPYLGMTHFPHYFAEALAEGKTAGEAAAEAMPVLSWQGVFVGDPLYRPFLKTPQEQMEEATTAPTRLSQYAFLRAANLAAAGGNADEADKILKRGAMFSPGLALNFFLVQKDFEKKGASSRVVPVRAPELENPGLLLETARLLAKASRSRDALRIYSTALERRVVPDFSREKVLREACDLARQTGDSAKLSAWSRELEKLKKK